MNKNQEIKLRQEDINGHDSNRRHGASKRFCLKCLWHKHEIRKLKGEKSSTKLQKMIIERGEWGINIFFADAKQSWQRVMAVFSALFWTWLEFSFLKFLFIFIIGIASHASGSPITYTWDLMLENNEFVDTFVKIFFVLVLILRIPIHYKKRIESDGWFSR